MKIGSRTVYVCLARREGTCVQRLARGHRRAPGRSRLSQEMAAVGGDAYFRARYSWWAVIARVAVHLGMVLREGPSCPQDCDCDPGLDGIPIGKVCGNTGHLVTSREVRVALASFDAWKGDIADIVVQHPFDEAPRPIGRDGAKSFLQFVEFLRASENEGFVAW